MGDQVEAPAASSTTVDMEAAEQLIQLSGGCDGDAGGGESESKSADSVKAGEEGREGDKEGVPTVVESSTGEKPGDDKEPVPAVVESSSAGKRCEKLGAKKGRVDDDEAVMGGVTRKKPRFRSLADIYRETKRIYHAPCREEDEISEGKKEKTMKKQKRTGRATDSAAGDEAVAVPAAAKKAVRRRSSTVHES